MAHLHLQMLMAVIVPTIAQLEMKFTKYPESVTAPLGDKVTFECEVNVPGERLIWRWKVDSDREPWVEIHEPANGRRVVPSVPGRSTKLEVELMGDIQESLYQCIVWYGAASLTSVPARLSLARFINANKINPEQRVISAPLYNYVALHCREPESKPPAAITWFKEGPRGKKKQLETPHNVLTIPHATAEDSGTYTCKATNEVSGDTLKVAQTVHLKIQHDTNREIRFLESDDYVGELEGDVLTKRVKPNGTLRLWCGEVGYPPPRANWTLDGEDILEDFNGVNNLVISPFTDDNEGIYACYVNGVRRSWKVISLQPPYWHGNVTATTPNEGGTAHVNCGYATGEPTPKVYWVLNSEVLKNEKGIHSNSSDLYIEHVEKKHAGIVQCFACNHLGCAYSATMLTVVPLQISDQDYSGETLKSRYPTSPASRRHNRKNSRKHKAVLIPPSKPNVTRLNDESVMVSWSHDEQGLPIRFFKVQYKEMTNSSNSQWNTASQDIPAHIHSYQIDGLTAGKYYKFRIAAVYSNQDNKAGKSSSRFHLLRGGFKAPRVPVLTKALPLSPNSVQIEWMWSSGGEVEAEGFYVYYRAVVSAGAYEKVTATGSARSLVLPHLAPDTGYDVKVQAYTAQAASEFTVIKSAKTLKSPANEATSTLPPPPVSTEAPGGPSPVVTGAALGAAALLLALAAALLLCRRARRPTLHKEKGPGPESGGANGYIPAKVPITITANPMHSEGGDAGVEMSFLHNNNTGNNDDTLPHSRKNGPTPRQYV